jgi:cytoskeletal protein CcmA (bactofilin family)
MPETPSTVAPPASREITCYRCGHAFGVSAKALSVFCKKCQQRLVLEDLRVTATHPGRELTTCGNLVVEATAKIHIQRVVAENVTVRGRVIANVVARGTLEIFPGGSVDGDVEASRILVRDGGILRGRCKLIRPPAASPSGALPPPPAVLTHRPAR